VRFARALSSPVGVLVTLPLLVVAVGVGILLVGRDATRTAASSMARHQLAEQARSVQQDVAFALDQAGVLFEPIRELADPARARDDVLVRLHDLIVGRPGVAYASISFPDGTFRGAYRIASGAVQAQESKPGAPRVRFDIVGASPRVVASEPHDYDPRRRDFYTRAVRANARVWTEPYTFASSFETGITCAEPVFDDRHELRAVLTVDFDVGALSSYVERPALDDARSIVFTRDGIVLAYPAGDRRAAPTVDKLLRREDLHDAAVDALFGAIDAASADAATSFRFVDLDTADGEYFASVAPIGGTRADVAVPLDWYVATVVPERTLFGATRRLERSSLLASAGALAVAVVLAVVLAWNVVRMRRQVAASREQARSAEARAKELGSYRLVAKLGTGGMGEVWRAEHRLLARQAAIKLIRAEALADDHAVAEMRERFRREAQTLASMKSRHTIAIFDYGVADDGTFYYVMELLDGLDLESLVARYGPQPPARVIRMLVQACQSLAEAHDAGLLHRDIKPPNLYACRAADELDIVKLLDFGIVQTRAEAREPPRSAGRGTPSSPKLTQVGAMLGTPGFMAPEQILGMKLDGRADLYALGCVAWWLLAGREVFSRDGGEPKVHHRHLHDDPPPLRDVVSGWLPSELESIIYDCLAKEIDDRPRDARALAARLRAIAIPAEHAWSEERAAEWWRGFEPVTSPSVPSAEVQVVVRGATAEPPSPSRTVVERSSQRTIVD
jgi:serine/threonine protein kinase